MTQLWNWVLCSASALQNKRWIKPLIPVFTHSFHLLILFILFLSLSPILCILNMNYVFLKKLLMQCKLAILWVHDSKKANVSILPNAKRCQKHANQMHKGKLKVLQHEYGAHLWVHGEGSKLLTLLSKGMLNTPKQISMWVTAKNRSSAGTNHPSVWHRVNRPFLLRDEASLPRSALPDLLLLVL